jgi:hypothetical protein
MASPGTFKPLTDESQDCISESPLASAHVPGQKHMQPDPGSQEWHDRLRGLEQSICELLIENQRLRMLLGEETMPIQRRNDGHGA